jgi:hypothetical protein
VSDRIRIDDLREKHERHLARIAEINAANPYDPVGDAGSSATVLALLDIAEGARDMVTTAVLGGHPMSEELEAALGRFDFGDER